jgi:autotransporter passenger strand-loop-strand repeat protein
MTTVSSGQTLTISAGQTSTGIVVQSGGSLDVLSGGMASGTVVSSGGAETVFSGGVGSGTVVSSGGAVELPLTSAYGPWSSNSANVIDGVTVQSGATVSLDIYQGGAISAFVVLSGGQETVFSGGFASGTTILGGGTEVVSSGGLTSNTVISSGGEEDLLSGGLVTGGITFSGSGGRLRIAGTTMPTNTISGFIPGDTIDLASIAYSAAGGVSLQSGNILLVNEDGSTFTIDLDPSQSFTGDRFQLSSDSAGGTLITEQPPIVVSSGVTSTGITVLSGGSETVLSGGTASATTIGSGGTETVSAGGHDLAAMISGNQDLYGTRRAPRLLGAASRPSRLAVRRAARSLTAAAPRSFPPAARWSIRQSAARVRCSIC